MKRSSQLSLIVMIIAILVGIASMACQYRCDFCGSYQLESDPDQTIVFERDGEFLWATPLAQASGMWYADGDKITVTTSWGTLAGRIEAGKFTDSGGSSWVQRTGAHSCILCCNIPRPAMKITPTPTPRQTPAPTNILNLGDWATSSEWWITVTSAERTVQYYDNATTNAPPNTSFIVVDVTVLNVGSSSMATRADIFGLSDKSGSAYQPLRLSILASKGFPSYAYSVAPGQTVSGRILYAVPESSSELTIVTLLNGQYLAWVLPW